MCILDIRTKCTKNLQTGSREREGMRTWAEAEARAKAEIATIAAEASERPRRE